eukprot:SAG11_NODE_671_length_7815_cov_3.408631_3_plen_135_part_00
MGQPHHDQNHRPLRWWTVLIYLSDQPEVSGGTTFPCYAPIEPTDDRGLAIEGAEGARADPQGERSALGNAVVSTIAQQHKSAPPPLGAHDEELCRTLVNGCAAFSLPPSRNRESGMAVWSQSQARDGSVEPESG